MVHGPDPETEGAPTVVQLPLVTLTKPAEDELDVCGAVQPNGTWIVIWDPALKGPVTALKVNVKLFPVDPAHAVLGETVIVPSPSFALASVNIAFAVSIEVWPVAVTSSVAPNSSSLTGMSQVVVKLPSMSVMTCQGSCAE